MAFQGNKFIFDGIPGEQYGLMLANINNANQDAGKIGGAWKVHEDRIARRSVGLDYGVTANDPLSFPITMVAMEDNHHFDRYDVAAVAGWLTGHQSFKQLIILQDDMENVYYRCRITQLEAVEVGMHVVGFKGTVTCDGPYAYRSVPTAVVTTGIAGAPFTYFNHSNVNDYFYPVITLAGIHDEVRIVNHSDQSRSFSLRGLPPTASSEGRTITIDCLHQVMTASDGVNLYQYWNTGDGESKYFPRFVRGVNHCEIGSTIYQQLNQNGNDVHQWTFSADGFEVDDEYELRLFGDWGGSLDCRAPRSTGEQSIQQSIQHQTLNTLFEMGGWDPTTITRGELYRIRYDIEGRIVSTDLMAVWRPSRYSMTIHGDVAWNIGN